MSLPKKNSSTDTSQLQIPIDQQEQTQLDISQLEQWLLRAANTIRGASDAPKFKDFILPLIFYKRLSDVFDDEFNKQIEAYGDENAAYAIIEADHEDALKEGRTPIVRFYIPEIYSWDKIRNRAADGNLGEFVTEAMREVAKLNPLLQGVLDVQDFNETQSGQRTLDEERLEALIEVLSEHRLGLHDTEPDILGRAYEYLLRKFAEGQGQSAGEFYSPKEVGELMARLIDPKPKTTIYDPTCGSGGLLIKGMLQYIETHTDDEGQEPHIIGQELTPTTFAMAKMNAFLHDFIDSNIEIGDTFRNPKFVTNNAKLQQFDYIVANPMWNQKEYNDDFYSNDNWQRFTYGTPPTSSADWGWVQHMYASLKSDGKAAIVLDTGAVSRGSGSKHSDKERDIRKQFVENDLIEAVILLPENLFYNTTAPGIILLLNCKKPEDRKGEILLINLSLHFEKQKPKNVLTDEGIGLCKEVYDAWESREKLSSVITLEDAQKTDYNLSPSQFVDVGETIEHRLMNEILADLSEAQIAREKADTALEDVLRELDL